MVFVAIALPALPSLFHAAQWARVETRRIGRWTLVIQSDSFTGQTRCHLRGPRMEVERGALIVRFAAHADTFAAQYRLDGGPVVAWRVNAMSLAANGVRIDNDDVANPSGGRVPVPLDQAMTAKSIAVRPQPGARVETFALGDLASALDAAAGAGCRYSASPGTGA